MMHSTLNRTEPHSFSPVRSRFPGLHPAFAAAFAAAILLAATIGARAQDAAGATPAPASADTAAAQSAPAGSSPAAATPAPGQAKPDIAVSNQKPAKKRKSAPADDKKAEKIVPSKDTKKAEKSVKKDSLVGVDPNLPDKALYDKAEDAIKHGRFDVGRLDLQALLNTYTESQYMMRAKLAIADSWYQEGGTAALTQAEQEYTDFITFFPNAPEAAEAQMRIGDIYYRQMDKPDRDNVSTVKAEAAYRQMLQQFPDSILVPQAKQKLREVQEALASGEDEVAGFYVTRSNLSAAIARYQTVVDTYPLYSHMDEVLIALGDADETEAKYVRVQQRLPEAAKAQLEKLFDDQAYAMFSKVVTEHSAAPHVEDARDRILAMNRPVPTPTPEQAAASEALENSRGQYTLSKRATLLFLHQADTVPAATLGDPPLEDAKPTLAPDVSRKTVADYYSAMNPAAAPHSGTPIPAAAASAAGGDAPAAAPPTLEDVPSVTEATPAGSSSGRTSMGIEIVQPTPGSAAVTAPATAPTTPPAFPGTATPSPDAAAPAALPPADATGGIGPVGPPNQAPLPPVEKPAVAPNAINDVTPGSQPPAQTAPADAKNPKAPCDKSDQSCSTHKPKKGLGKLNPF